MPEFLVTIGLEVHVQLNTKSKMFCGCPVSFGDQPNTNVCPVCLGLPGALPVINRAAVEKTILTGLMLGCRINDLTTWDRKNYFYPDMPKNYQISQFDLPLCVGGGVPLYEMAYPKDAQKSIPRPNHTIALTRIHLEEDVGKSTHLGNHSTIDFNRAGSPLMEIVSEPDLETAEEAVAYLGSLRQILVYGGVSDADMEKGQMRCDVNISVRPSTQKELGPKVELKNLNSPAAVRRAIKFEIDRQITDWEKGILQIQSTRRWDDTLGETQLMRTKEDAHDYRYFPDPDLLPVHAGKMVERIRANVPELPHQKRARFVTEHGVSDYDAGVLASDQALAGYFEEAVSGAKSGKRVANWIINDLLATLNQQSLSITESPLPPSGIRDLANAIEVGTITNNQGKEVYAALMESGASVATIIKDKGFEIVSDTAWLDTLIEQAMAIDPPKVAEIKAGNAKLLNWLVGQVMKLSQGKANPKVITDTLRAKLDLTE